LLRIYKCALMLSEPNSYFVMTWWINFSLVYSVVLVLFWRLFWRLFKLFCLRKTEEQKPKEQKPKAS